MWHSIPKQCIIPETCSKKLLVHSEESNCYSALRSTRVSFGHSCRILQEMLCGGIEVHKANKIRGWLERLMSVPLLDDNNLVRCIIFRCVKTDFTFVFRVVKLTFLVTSMNNKQISTLLMDSICHHMCIRPSKVRNRLQCHLVTSNRHGLKNRLKYHLFQSIILSLSLIAVNVIDYHFHLLQ